MKQRKHRRTFPRTNIFVWHSICWGIFGTVFAQPAILAEIARRLPFWQVNLAGCCHYDSRLHRLVQPLRRGGVPANPSLGGITTQPYHMISPPPRIGGSMPLPNKSKLSSKRTPINGGWVSLDPLPEPLVCRDSNQQPMVKYHHFQPSHPNGDTSSPIAATASYCDRKASTRSRLPGLPTFTIIVSSPPL